jgi:pimeloyl-ACP methyl ester carboxylesterase
VSDLCADIERQLELHFRGKPVSIAWALKDIAFTEEVLELLWRTTFPEAEVVRLPDAGHYLQEDAYEQILPALIEQLRR